MKEFKIGFLLKLHGKNENRILSGVFIGIVMEYYVFI